jgi:hypothetical protein
MQLNPTQVVSIALDIAGPPVALPMKRFFAAAVPYMLCAVAVQPPLPLLASRIAAAPVDVEIVHVLPNVQVVPFTVVDGLARLALGSNPVTPVLSGNPVALVSTAAEGVPRAGVTRVGEVA